MLMLLSFFGLALALGGAEAPLRSGDAGGAGQLDGGVGEGDAGEREDSGLGGGPGDGLAGGRVLTNELAEHRGGDKGRVKRIKED